MWRFIVKRLIQLFFVFIIALTVIFIIPRLLPGNPAQFYITQVGTTVPMSEYAVQVREEIMKRYGLTKSYAEQFVLYLINTFQGYLGVSMTYFPRTVVELILSRLPWTLAIMIPARILTFLLGYFIGTIAAWKPGRKLDVVIQFAGLSTIAFPIFWVGALMLMVFSYYIPIFPRGGSLTPGVVHKDIWSFLVDATYHAALPIITLTIFSFFGEALIMRNNMLMVLREDYILTAFAKGLSERTVMFKHAARNALLPLVTGLFAGLGYLIVGSIFIETIFAYPGVGYLFNQAILLRDYPLVQGLFILITAITLISNFIADLLYRLLDPRVRLFED
ncbi:MAG: ABC transporter permease [Candidatus Bathyarchaeia archaeon]|nr:ABC transporter permease [Candidatus Bathyarchaeota archaeon]